MARKFNGSTDRINVDTALLQPNLFTGTFSLAVWVKGAAQANTGIYSEGQTGATSQFWWIGPDSTATSKMRWSPTNGPAAYVTSATVFDSTWHHYALVVTNNTYWVYVDGVLDGGPTNISAAQVGPSGLGRATIGALGRSTFGNFFTGQIAHLATWGNRPLTAEEVRMLARGVHLPSAYQPTNYWQLSGPDGVTARSLGRRRNHGTLVGTTFSADVPPLVGRTQPSIWGQRYARWRVPELALPFINSVATVYTPSLIGTLDVPFIASTTTVYTPSLGGTVTVPFIASTTSVYTPSLVGALAVPFIGSVTSVYTPALTGAGTDVNVPFIASSTNVYAPGLPYVASAGVILVVPDDSPYQTPSQALSGVIVVAADAPATAGPYTPNSGSIILRAGSPTQPSLIQPTSGVITVAADQPHQAGSYIPNTGQIFLRADAPTVTPFATTAGVIHVKGDAPLETPVTSVPGRIILAGGPHVSYPLVATSGVIVLKAGDADFAHVGYILNQSGIIRLRSDVPVVTPLTEPPPPPPPPPPGTGLAISGTA